MTITKFIAAGNTYLFPTSPGDQEYKTNFANMVTKITRLPGTDGGYDEYAFSRAPSEIGSVQFGIVLVSATRAGMQPLRDALKTIAAWGMGRLIDNVNGVERWCWAKIAAGDITEQRAQNSDLFQPVKLTFSVPDPYWYATGTETTWGSGWKWGDGTKWGGSLAPTTITASGTITVTNNGSADTYARVIVANTSGSTIADPIIRRMVNGAVVDEVKYTGTIATGTTLSINPRSHKAVVAGVNHLENLTYKNSNWIKLAPGSNTLKVYVEGVADVYIRYFERYI